ncbi:MAG: Gfo/Idh/MocA family oxidoreductase [Clostridiales bacterium]|jgi:predicted dehydrogenase|nr:Gfo/Idh/MocA family oxidoreductase [Clostridiales bacterium]
MKIGILGLGAMARVMADTLVQMEDVECRAVASRDKMRAEAFAKEFGFQRAYGSYEELVRDPGVELVYVATPHSHHFEHAKLCLEGGKPALVEKAFTVNARQAEALIELSRQKGLLLAEAIWTRYAPIRRELEGLVANSPVGNIRMLTANLGYPVMHRERLRDPKLAGGALLDVGVYAINFALMAFGTDIASIASAMSPTDTGVDMQNAVAFTYRDGKLAALSSTIAARMDRRGVIMGDEGYIVCENINDIEMIRAFRFDGDEAQSVARREVLAIPAPAEISGYEHEVRAAMRAVREGKAECAEMPHGETLRVMKIMDEIRAQWGLAYPGE